MELNIGLPQVSMPASLLFSFYIVDMAQTKSRKFDLTDNWVLTISHEVVATTENALMNDLTVICKYFIEHILKFSVKLSTRNKMGSSVSTHHHTTSGILQFGVV